MRTDEACTYNASSLIEPRAPWGSNVRRRLANLRSVFLFPPCVMGVAAIGLARAMIWLDQSGALSGAVPSELLYAEGAGAATTLLSVIAGLLVGVMTTLFSMTLATLTFASTQFGPRLLQLFLRDRRPELYAGWLSR